jgi:hypothetical protein
VWSWSKSCYVVMSKRFILAIFCSDINKLLCCRKTRSRYGQLLGRGGLQNHVSIVPTTDVRFANGVFTTSTRRRSRGGGEFLVLDPRPRPSRLPREVLSGFQETIGCWVIMNARDISVDSYDYYSRGYVDDSLLQRRGSLSLKRSLSRNTK